MISSDYPTKKIRQEMLSDNPVYNDFNQPVSSSFPYRRTTTRESNLPETNYYSQPTQMLESRYYDHVPMRETAEEENSRLREQNGIVRQFLKINAGFIWNTKRQHEIHSYDQNLQQSWKISNSYQR